jgi:uncharacterized C2H2 Zn-finger protein
MMMSVDDEFDPLYCVRCHKPVARAAVNPDGWCASCVAEEDRERRDAARRRDEETKPRCPRCGGTEMALTMGTTPARQLGRVLGFLLRLEFTPLGLWRSSDDVSAAWRDQGEPMWRCTSCDYVFRMR